MERPTVDTGTRPPVGQAAPAAEDRKRAFFRALGSGFDQAAGAAGGAVERCFQVGGRRLRLRFAGPTLLPVLTPPLEHLAVSAPGRPDLTVYLWDTASTGVQPPPPPWSDDAYLARAGIDHGLGEKLHAAFFIDRGILYLFDATAGLGFYWVRDPRQVPPWDRAAPLRPLLNWWAGSGGGRLVHGAAVGLPGSGILLTAPGGSGKSTTALACLQAGLLFLGDDYVLVRDDGEPSVHSLYSSAKLVPRHLRRMLPRLETAVARSDGLDGDKAVLLLAPGHRGRLTDGLPLCAIAVPRLSPTGRTAVRPASPVEVLTALAPTTLLQLPGTGSEALAALGRLVRRMPRYTLEVGTDLDEVVAAVRGLLREGGNGAH
jgi:hypothetical protein